MAYLDGLLNDYRRTGDHEAEGPVELLDTLVERARTYAATTKNELRRRVVQQLSEQAAAMAATYRSRASTPRAAVAGEEGAGTRGGVSDASLAESEKELVARAKRLWDGPVAEQAQQLEQRRLEAGRSAFGTRRRGPLLWTRSRQ
ncbi:hypothetical protein OG206_01295 [Streptomyces sp. NBC_01341]|uniref:hypothetical protein n=1 Tax=Streptomyces sp. NBC_01341 TaxID=2903831 RepID=UPI002E10B1E1|nr:hypothetical protein OG206_01295 [Streptomyces sp. NBC_01341]